MSDGPAMHWPPDAMLPAFVCEALCDIVICESGQRSLHNGVDVTIFRPTAARFCVDLPNLKSDDVLPYPRTSVTLRGLL